MNDEIPSKGVQLVMSCDTVGSVAYYALLANMECSWLA